LATLSTVSKKEKETRAILIEEIKGHLGFDILGVDRELQ